MEGRPRPALDTGAAVGAAFEAGLALDAGATEAGLGAALDTGLEEAISSDLVFGIRGRDLPARAILIVLLCRCGDTTLQIS